MGSFCGSGVGGEMIAVQIPPGSAIALCAPEKMPHANIRVARRDAPNRLYI
jgi:hypothetical protein